MQRICDDERRRNGALAPGPYGVGPKSFLKASKMLESGPHFLALFSCSGTILDTNAFSFPD
jgi:hypothetical protein